MNRDAVLAELTPDHRAWLRAYGSPATFESTARDVATATGRRLLVQRGAAGWDRILHALLVRADQSPAVRAIAARLGCAPCGRHWSTHQVTKELQEFFSLHSAYKAIYKGLSADLAESALAAA